MSTDFNQTGVLTDPTIAPPLSSPAPMVPSVNSAQASIPDPNLINKYEERVRSLMSEKDKTRADWERAVRERADLQAKYDELAKNHQDTLAGAHQTIEESLNARKAVEAELAKEKAGRLKYELAASKYPELREYISLIPDSTDQAKLEESFAALKAAREKDIQAALASVPQQQPAPSNNTNPLDVLRQYPSNTVTVDGITPARPAAGTNHSVDSVKALENDLQLKMQEAILNGNLPQYEQYLAQQAQTAALYGRQQLGLSQ